MLIVEKPEEMMLYNIYLKLIDVWIDKQENLITIKEGNIKIDGIIKEMEVLLKEYPQEAILKDYFFITGEGWKHYHPFNLNKLSAKEKAALIDIRTGVDRFYNPDFDMVAHGEEDIKDMNGPEEMFKYIQDKIKNSGTITPEDVIVTQTQLDMMDETLEKMEENLKAEKEAMENKNQEDQNIEELMKNEGVKENMENIKEEKNKKEETKTSDEQKFQEETKAEQEEAKKEEASAKEETKNKFDGIGWKLGLGVAVAGVVAAGVWYIRKKIIIVDNDL